MEEKMMNEEVIVNENETTDIMPVNETTESTSGSIVVKAVVVGVCGLVAGGVALGAKKLKEHSRKRTIEKLRNEGWTVEEPVEIEEDDFDDDALFFEPSEEESKEEENK